MQKVNGAGIIEALKWRYATKKFDPARKISAADWATLQEALVLSPSSFGLQPWKFFVIEDPKTRAALRPEAWGQPQITDASHLVLLAAKNEVTPADVDRHMSRICAVRGVTADALSEYRKAILNFLVAPPPGFDLHAWTARQVYLALGNLLTTAALLGIDACPMEGFSPSKFDELLKLSAKGYTPSVLCALGYRAADDGYAKMLKVRFPASEIIESI
jgi:nitroreductase